MWVAMALTGRSSHSGSHSANADNSRTSFMSSRVAVRGPMGRCAGANSAVSLCSGVSAMSRACTSTVACPREVTTRPPMLPVGQQPADRVERGALCRAAEVLARQRRVDRDASADCFSPWRSASSSSARVSAAARHVAFADRVQAPEHEITGSAIDLRVEPRVDLRNRVRQLQRLRRASRSPAPCGVSAVAVTR